jgi:type VI secretion system ImpH/TssG family protein
MTARMLAQRAVEQAERLPFVSLVRWLEHGLAARARVGGDGPLRDEVVELACSPALGFAAADQHASSLHEDHARVVLLFGGLVGAASPLPPSMIEALAAHDDDTRSERAFLDLFHHRLLGLTYRGLLKFDLARSSDAQALDWMLGLTGLPVAEVERISGLPRTLLWRLTPLLLFYPANAARIPVALRLTFEELATAPIEVRELRGGLVPVEVHARLGRALRLGDSFTLGSRAPAPSSAIEVAIGPLVPELAARFAPGGAARAQLEATLALLCPETVEVDLTLHLTHGTPTPLGRVRLGRASWLGARARPAPIRWRSRGGEAWTSPY